MLLASGLRCSSILTGILSSGSPIIPPRWATPFLYVLDILRQTTVRLQGSITDSYESQFRDCLGAFPGAILALTRGGTRGEVKSAGEKSDRRRWVRGPMRRPVESLRLFPGRPPAPDYPAGREVPSSRPAFVFRGGGRCRQAKRLVNLARPWPPWKRRLRPTGGDG